MTSSDDFEIQISAWTEESPRDGDRALPDEEVALLGAQVENEDYSARRISHLAVGDGSTLSRCSFQGAIIQSGVLAAGVVSSTYIDCNFNDCYIDNVIPGRARFIRCTFRSATITNMRFLDAELIDCVFAGALIENVIFDADRWVDDPSVPSYEYYGNDFSSARLRNVSFRGGIDLNSQRLPRGDEYLTINNAEEALRTAWSDAQQWGNEDYRNAAETILAVFRGQVQRKQRDIFIEKELLTQGLPDTYADKIVRAILLSSSEK